MMIVKYSGPLVEVLVSTVIYECTGWSGEFSPGGWPAVQEALAVIRSTLFMSEALYLNCNAGITANISLIVKPRDRPLSRRKLKPYGRRNNTTWPCHSVATVQAWSTSNLRLRHTQEQRRREKKEIFSVVVDGLHAVLNIHCFYYPTLNKKYKSKQKENFNGHYWGVQKYLE